MADTTEQRGRPHLAYYTDGIAWSSSEWAKSMLLFFDGIAILVPAQEDAAFQRSDESVIAGMTDAGCLRVLRPDELVDEATAAGVMSAVSAAVEREDWRGSEVAGVLDLLYLDKMGYRVSREPFELMAQQLKDRKLASDWEHGASMAVDRRVCLLTLSVIAAQSRRRGEALGLRLTPTTDGLKWGRRQREFASHPTMDACARILLADADQLNIDVGAVPIDELVGFRRNNASVLDRYRLSVAKFARDIQGLDPEDQRLAVIQRTAELADARHDIERVGRDFWLTTGRVSLAIGGIAWTCFSGDPTGAILGVGELAFEGAAALGAANAGGTDFSYVISAARTFPAG